MSLRIAEFTNGWVCSNWGRQILGGRYETLDELMIALTQLIQRMAKTPILQIDIDPRANNFDY